MLVKLVKLVQVQSRINATSGSFIIVLAPVFSFVSRW